MLLLGVLMVGLDFMLPASMRTMILAPIGWIGVLGIIIIDWRTANRWVRERQARP